jgi:hypothetical protein
LPDGSIDLFYLDHAAKILQLQGATQVVQVVHVKRGILGREFNIVIIAGVADELHQCRPAGQEVRAERRLISREQCA